MAQLRLFGQARIAAGVGTDEVEVTDVDQVSEVLAARYGEGFAAVLASCALFVNGERATLGQIIRPGDEIAVLPPVSGGS